MALIKCPECGKEISDKALSCPNCGMPISTAPPEETPTITAKEPIAAALPQNNDPKESTTKNKNTKLSIVSLVFSILGVLFFLAPFVWIGIILGCIDFFIHRENRKFLVLVISIALGAVGVVLCSVNSFAESENTPPTNAVVSEQTQENTIDEISTSAPTEIASTESEAEDDEMSQEYIIETETVLTETKEEFIATCQNISYKDLLRTPDEYTGQRIVITAKIQQVLQGGWLDDNQYYRVQTDNDGYDWYFDDEYFMYDYRIDDTTKLLQDDILKIYAEFAGLETVERALTGVKEEVPAIKAYYIEIIGE